MSVIPFLFVGSITLLGVIDLRYKNVPLWLVGLNVISSMGMSFEHPLFSIISAGVIIVFVLLMRMGIADKLVFPAIAAAFPLLGILLIFFTLFISILHIKVFKTSAPMLFYLWVLVLVIYALTGGQVI